MIEKKKRIGISGSDQDNIAQLVLFIWRLIEPWGNGRPHPLKKITVTRDVFRNIVHAALRMRSETNMGCAIGEIDTPKNRVTICGVIIETEETT